MSNTSTLQPPKQLRGSYCDGAARGFDVLDRGPGVELSAAAGEPGGSERRSPHPNSGTGCARGCSSPAGKKSP